MAKFLTNFSGQTLGVDPPVGWTGRGSDTTSWTVTADAGASGGKKVVTAGVPARGILSWDGKDSADTEILSLIEVGAGTDKPIGGVFVRGGGGAGTEDAYLASLNRTSEFLDLGKYVAGSYTSLGTFTIPPTLINNPYYLRLRANGTAVKAKIWAATDSEPGAWGVEVTDSDLTTGWVGLVGTPSTPTDYDVVAVATAGETASFDNDVTITAATEAPTVDFNLDAPIVQDITINATTEAPTVDFNIFLAPKITVSATTEAPNVDLNLIVGQRLISIGATTDAPVVSMSMFNDWGGAVDEFATEFYTLTLTKDGEDDLVLPMKSFQARMSKDNASYVSCVVPAVDQFAVDIAAMVGGVMEIRQGYILSNGFTQSEIIISVALNEDIRTDKGVNSESTTLSGLEILTQPPSKTVTLSDINYRSTNKGKRRVRAAKVNLFLRAGDTAVDGSNEFVVDTLSYIVSVNQGGGMRQSMEVAE